jgi:Bacterial archaeo-eukaryotic release factor family 7
MIERRVAGFLSMLTRQRDTDRTTLRAPSLSWPYPHAAMMRPLPYRPPQPTGAALFEELVVVDAQAHITPLLSMLSGDGQFYVLTLGLGGVRLFRGTRYGLSPVTLHGVPASLQDALAYDEFAKQAQSHPGMPGRGGEHGAIFHGQGARDGTVVKQETLRYFQQVERGNIGADALRTLSPQAETPVEIPAAGARVTLPLHILARIGQPGGQLIARLRWQDGTELVLLLAITVLYIVAAEVTKRIFYTRNAETTG